jgi:Cyclic nucleotide-binding domain
MRVRSEVTTVSWIPSEAVTGMMKTAFSMGVSHYDAAPPDELGDLASLTALRDSDAYRYANRLSAWAEFDGDRVVDCGYDGGVLMGSTTAKVGPIGMTLAAIPLPDLQAEPEIAPGEVRFRQTCGGRTAMPMPRRVAHPPYVRLQPPLVWSTLTLVLRADGSCDYELVGASPFPRHWVYGPDGRLAAKAGLTDFAKWSGQESRATPWGDEDSPVVVTAAETELERRLSGSIMRGGDRPAIRRLAAGDVLTRQGETADEVYLLLDGVMGVDRDGDRLAELGPGAVLGERSVLEGGLRTATLTALTAVRVAAVRPDALDRDALAELAAGHRREQVDA